MRALRHPEARRREVRHRARVRQPAVRRGPGPRRRRAAGGRSARSTASSSRPRTSSRSTTTRRTRGSRAGCRPRRTAGRRRAVVRRAESGPRAGVAARVATDLVARGAAGARRRPAPRRLRIAAHRPIRAADARRPQIPLRRVRRTRARLAVRDRARATCARSTAGSTRAAAGAGCSASSRVDDARRVGRLAAAVEHVVRRGGDPVQPRRADAALVGTVRLVRLPQVPGPHLPLHRRRPAAGAGRRAASAPASPGSSRASTRSPSSATARSCATSSPPGSCSASCSRWSSALIAHLRNREYAALDRAPRGRGAAERAVAPARRVEAASCCSCRSSRTSCSTRWAARSSSPRRARRRPRGSSPT